jgi:hypothetical protein
MLVSFIFSSYDSSYLLALLSHSFYIVTAKTETFITPLDELPHSLLIQVRVLCYQPSRNSCVHLAIIVTFVVAKIWLQRGKQMLIGWRQTPTIQSYQRRYISYIIRNVRLFSRWPSCNVTRPVHKVSPMSGARTTINTQKQPSNSTANLLTNAF